MSLGSRFSSSEFSGLGQDTDGVWDEDVLGDMHLNSAINLDTITENLYPGRINYRVMENRRVAAELIGTRSLVKRNTPITVGFQSLFHEMFSLDQELTSMETRMTRMIMSIMDKSLKLYSLPIPLSRVKESHIIDGAKIPSVLNTWFDFFLKCIYARSEWIRSAGLNLKFGAEQFGGFVRMKTSVGGKSYSLHMGKEIVSIKTTAPPRIFIADFSSLLLLLDVSGQRICAHLCSSLGRLTGVPGSLRTSDLSYLCTLGDKVINIFGNKGYEILGMFESLCVGVMLKGNADGITNNLEFYDNCMEELNGMIDETEQPGVLREIITGLIRCIESMEVEDISNAFCLYRIWGHPTVDIYEGMKKVHSLGTKDKDIPPWIGTIALCQFRKMFMSNYFKRNGTYPPYEGEETGYVGECLKKKIPIRVENIGYNIRDFENIRLCETYRVPETYDMCHILNDKAVSPDLDELIESIGAGKGTNCGAKRRGILRWMEGKSVNCREFLTRVSKEGLPENELLIGMYEKEREIKVAARMYSLMTETMRYYFVLTEGLIADHILPHFPEITMKDSLNVLLKKMWEAGGQRSVGSKDTNINIDFSKWNTNMRETLTMPVFHEMDRIFGFEHLIGRTHDFFLRSLVYSASGKYSPILDKNKNIIEESPMCYRGHQGGFEGLRQKGWTVATVCILAYLAERQKIGMGLMGQGDNQIIRLRMPTGYWRACKMNDEMQKREARLCVDRFVREMDNIFSGAGLPIKVRETWTSSRLFMYGKVMLLDGKQLPQWYKKTLRSYALSNEGTLTISGVVGTIATNMCSAAGGSETPCVMYLFFLLLSEWSLLYMFKYHPFTREKIRDGDIMSFSIVENGRRSYKDTKRVEALKLKALIVLVPTAVGGSITIPLTGYIMRGFPDKASEGYAWLKFLSSCESPLQRYLKNFYTFLPNDTIEADMLVQSPFSVNHKRPPTPGLQTRENIREWMLSTPKFKQNRFISGMKELLGGFPKKLICAELLTDVMNPLITHEVYETFGQVYCEGIVSRVENTRTIRTMHLQREDREPIVSKLMADEMSYIAYIWWRAWTKGVLNNVCATKQAREARNLGWGRRITGITTPHPLEVLFSRVCTPLKKCIWDDDHILSKLVEGGEFPPFLGSKIKTKVYSLQDEEARKEPLIKTGARLARQFNWIDMGKNMRDLVMQNVSALCNISVFDTFVDDDPSDNLYTGSVMHRFTPASVSEGCFINYAPQIGHTVFMTSDTLPSLSRGQTNFTFHFQAMYCFLQYVISKCKNEGSYHHHVGCKDCVVEVEDDFDDIISIKPHIEKAQTDKYIDIIKDTLGYISIRPPTVVPSTREPPLGIYIDSVEGKERQLSDGVMELICWKVAGEILSKTQDTHSSVGTEDLQGWPRIYSYKMSRKRIIATISTFILFQVSCMMNEVPLLENMERIRRRAIDAVSTVGVGGFSGAASLCLGRDYPALDDEVVIVEGFAYPETVMTCLSSVKSSILLTVGKLITLGRHLSRRCIYPTEGMVSREFFGLLSCKGTIIRRCTVVQNHWEKDKEMDTPLSDIKCQHRCLEKLMQSNLLVHMTTDRAMKYLPVLDTKMPKNEIRTLPHGIASMSKIPLDNRAFTSTTQLNLEFEIDGDVSEHRMIQYPTSSVYKWADVMSKLESPSHVIVLGDGTGGTSLVAAHLYENANIYPMALLESKNLVPQDLDSLSPPLSRHYRNVKNEMLIDLPDDIRKKSFGSRLSDKVSDLVGTVRIISDIEGSGGMLETILGSLENMPLGTELLLKTYLSDLCRDYCMIRSFSDLHLIVSPLGNLRYGEMFLWMTIGGSSGRPERSSIQGVIRGAVSTVSDMSMELKMNTMRQIEMSFPHAVHTSVNIAFMKMAGWGGSFSPKVLKENNMRLIGYIYQYINTHYHFASSRYRPGDGRTITPLRSENLTRLFSSFLLGVFGESSQIREEISRMSLIGDRKGLSGRTYFKVRVFQGKAVREITSDELNVGRIIRNKRIRDFEFKVEEGPIGTPFEDGALLKIQTWGYKVPISSSAGWIEEHLHV